MRSSVFHAGLHGQLTIDELNEDAVANVKLGHGRDDRVGKFAGVVLLPRMSRPSSPMVQSTPVESIVHLVSSIAVVISNGFCSSDTPRKWPHYSSSGGPRSLRGHERRRADHCVQAKLDDFVPLGVFSHLGSTPSPSH
jgi:hypothetical protein